MEGGGGEAKPSPNPKPSPPPPRCEAKQRDFLLHVESYLARRDGVDKLLKIARYAAKIALASHAPLPGDLAPRLKVFESSVGLSRKAFRLGKFVQDVNALRAATSAVSPSSVDVLLATLAYGGEGLYYFVEQLVWLSKAGLLGPHRARQFQQLSAWAELVGYVGSIALKAREIAGISAAIESKATKSTGGGDGVDGEIRKLREKLVMKRLSVVQDVADGLMALADVRGGKGLLTDPLLMASAGLLSALISAHKNWASC